jgi:hypothetical protein
VRHVSRLPRAPAAPRGNTAVRGNTPASWAAWRPRLAWLAAWAAVVPVALTRASSLAEPDTFWEIRTGQLILRTGHIPAADSFSWWARGRPWTPNSWAFDVLLALCYRAGGLTFVALAGSGLVLGVAAAVLLLARGLGARPAAAGVLVTAAMAGMFGWLSVRPQLVDFAALPLLLLLGAGSRTPRVRTLLAIAAIEAGWVNLHAAAPLGAVVLLGAGIGGQAGTVLSTGRRALPGAAVRVLAPALAALAGTFANPRGVGVLSQVGTVSGSSAGLITEWEHVSLSSPGQVAMLGTGLLAALVAARRRGVSGRLRAHRASAGRPAAATSRWVAGDRPPAATLPPQMGACC